MDFLVSNFKAVPDKRIPSFFSTGNRQYFKLFFQGFVFSRLRSAFPIKVLTN